MTYNFLTSEKISIQHDALDFARAFLREGQKQSPSTDQVVAFVWYDDRRYREKGTNIWHRLQPGFDLCLFDRSKIPANAVWGADFPFAVQVPPNILAKFRTPEICIIGRSPTQISLSEKSG